jgi:hypothetical protein
VNTTMRIRKSVAGGLPAVALLITLAACGPGASTAGGAGGGAGGGGGSGGVSTTPTRATPLFADDFSPVCEGATVKAATPYDKSGTTGHKAVYLETYKDGNLVDSSTELPDDWTVQFTATGNAYAAIDVVICAKRTAQTFATNCDGYTVDDKPDALVVKMYTATYTVSAFEATTGKQLGTAQLAATDGTCPLSEFNVAKGTTTMNDYATPSKDQIVAFAKPFVQP